MKLLPLRNSKLLPAWLVSNSILCLLSFLVLKWRKFTLTLFHQKFRESIISTFTGLISRNNFWWEWIAHFSTLCVLKSVTMKDKQMHNEWNNDKIIAFQALSQPITTQIPPPPASQILRGQSMSHEMSVKDGIVIAFMLGLWMYSIFLMFR